MFRWRLCFSMFLGLTLIVNCWAQEITKVKKELITSCDCYMLGTIETKHGSSACNKQGICKCLPNVVGTTCTKCKEGFYGILEGKGCKACGCNVQGSQSINCHPSDGDCLCKDGYTGPRCDMCDIFEVSSLTTCKTPCDLHRSIDPFALYENGRCICKPHAIGWKCERCEDNFYFNQTILECTTCYTTCYKFLAEKLNNARNTLQNISERITHNLQSTGKPEYEFLVKLKTMQNKCCSLLNILLQKPQIQQIVKVKHLTSIVDLTAKSIQDISFYLNGHINYHHIAKKLHNLEKMLSELEKQVLNGSAIYDAEIKNIAENSHTEAKNLIEFVDKMDYTNKKLHDYSDHINSTVTRETKKMKNEQDSNFKEFLKTLNGNLENSTRLLEKAKQLSNYANINKKNAQDNYDEANNLKLPDKIAHELKPIVNGTFADLSERIQDAKRKYDAINNFLNVLNDTESKAEINGDINNILLDRTKNVSASVNEEQRRLSETFEEHVQTGNKLNELMITLDKNITKLSSDIDEKQKALKDILSNAEKTNEQLDKHNKDEQELKDYLEKLLKLWKKYKEDRMILQELIDLMRKLLEKRKQIQELIDETQKAIGELRTYIQKYDDQILLMKEIIEYLKLITIDFDGIEKLLKEYKEYISYIRVLRNEAHMLREEIKTLYIILKSLPDENPNVCNSKLT